MHSYEKLILENKAWALEVEERDPSYFQRLARGQTPEFLWIGCADSRVPGDIIVNAEPGQIFSHRNIANQVVASDINCLSVIQYAVDVLEVKDIIVCGHYNCGGVKAALQEAHPEYPALNEWLLHVRAVRRDHHEELEAIASEGERANRLVEINVIEQVNRLSQTPIVQSAWKKRGRPFVHGWVFGLEDGLLRQLISLKSESIGETRSDPVRTTT